MTPWRVLYLEAGSGQGGSAMALYRLLACLDRSRWEPCVIAHQDGPLIERIRNLGVETQIIALRPSLWSGRSGLWWNLAVFHVPLIIRLLGVLRRMRPALIHVNNSAQVGFAPIVAARLCRIPVVCHMRATRPLGRLERWVVRWIQTLIVLSESMVKTCQAQRIPPAKVMLIQDGIDLKAFSDSRRLEARRALGIPAQTEAIGIVGRLLPFKGHEEFLRAGALLAQSHPNLTLVVAGSSVAESNGFEQRLHDLAHTLDMTRVVRWLGWQSDVAQVYAALDVLVMPSRIPEGFGLVLVEAMASGVPVVASNLGAVSGLVTHGKTGLLVPPGDHERLAEAIGQFLGQPQVLRVFSRAAIAHAQQFDITVTARQLEQLYGRLLAAGRAQVARGVAS